MNNQSSQKILEIIATCIDTRKLRQIAKNARFLGDAEVERTASLRLYSILPAEEPDTFEHDVWQSIHALEYSLTLERGRTTRLTRTRQKIAKAGELKTVVDLLLNKKPSDGFQMLIIAGCLNEPLRK